MRTISVSGEFITFALSNFGLCMLLLALVLMIVHFSIRGGKLSHYEIVYRWIALFPLGLTGIYAGLMHLLFPDFTAASIGWANSPFQYEVAMADLGFGLIGILSFNASYGFRLATVIGNTVWLWGDAIGHIYQMVTYHNATVGNAGSWFWLDVIIPLILVICIIKLKPVKRFRYA